MTVAKAAKLLDKARGSQWGCIEFSRGKVLFMRLNKERIVLVEPDGGYFYPLIEPMHSAEMPPAEGLATALSGVSSERLGVIAKFTNEPRTMVEIDSQFPGVEAWRLRHIGVLVDVGRRQRRIISKWFGYEVSKLVSCVFALAKKAPFPQAVPDSISNKT
jgi:hypothetical protein